MPYRVQMFWITGCGFRIRRYLPCCADEAIQTSGLRKVTEADFKKSNLQSGGSNCGSTKINTIKKTGIYKIIIKIIRSDKIIISDSYSIFT